MRGAARLGGRKSYSPKPIKRGVDPLDRTEDIAGVLEFFNVGDLPVPPTLTPINDEWSISDPFEPVDPRDCSKYPASPYCEGDTIRFGPPVGFEYEFRTNGCTTCLYIYPVVGWMKLTPTVVCRRDPNCKEDNPPPDLNQTGRPPDLSGTPRNSSYCAEREASINREVNNANRSNEREEIWLNYNREIAKRQGAEFIELETVIQYRFVGGRREAVSLTARKLMFIMVDPTFEGDTFTVVTVNAYRPDRRRFGRWLDDKFDPNYESGRAQEGSFTGDTEYRLGYSYVTWTQGECPDGIVKPPPPPPPPFGRDDDRKKKKEPEGMCCNTCRDAKDNSDKLLKELREIKKRLGTTRYPVEAPESLLTGGGDKTLKIESITDYMYWLTYQLDALIGEFPLKIEIKDTDPLTAGDQKQIVEIPNIAEALAELYGLTAKSAINQEVELNMLFRLASEVIAAKNAAIVGQDYSRANAEFLGYRGNVKDREVTYAFDFANQDIIRGNAFTLESLLNTVEGHVTGWKNEDKETLIAYLQKLMFAAGIIKGVFFRNKKQAKDIADGIDDMYAGVRGQEQEWDDFYRAIKDPNSEYNVDATEKPDLKRVYRDPNKLL